MKPEPRYDRRTLLGGLAGAASVLLPGTASAAATVLTVNGTKLRWKGPSIRLRGVSTGDPYAARWWRPDSDYALISSWRANVVRFGIHPGIWRDQQADAKFYLDRDIKAALAADMWVVVDWHMIGWPDVPPPNPDYDTDFSLAKDFWTYVAATYGDDGRIAFELLNEPNTGNVNNPTTWPELRNYFVQLVNIVRARSLNLILCTGDCGAYDLRTIKLNPVPGANIGYTWHLYAGHSNNIESEWARFLDGLDKVFPVFCTEWGFNPDPSCAGYHFCSTMAVGERVFQFIDTRSLHMMAWVWQPDWGISLVESDWTTPTMWGQFVKDALAVGPVRRP